MAQAQKIEKEYTSDQMDEAEDIIYSDHAEFSEEVLKIYNTKGEKIPFKKNRAQIEFGKVWDECIRRFGYVRIVTVKARKRGISTEVAGRFVQGLCQAEIEEIKCDSLVLAHDDPSSTALFGITKKMIDNIGDFAPRLISDSMHRLDTAISSYLCMTAGKQKADGSGKGRAMTPRQVHISEAAHIANAQTLASSVISAVPCVPGTVIVMESTANGEGDYFHAQYVAAKKGETDFLPFFAPWFWDDDNQCDVPEGLILTKEDRTYKRKYELNMRQMAWRRKMEITQGLTAKEGKLIFKQENPANDEEAFSFSVTESFIPVDVVLDAQEREQYPGRRECVIGSLDPSECTDNDDDAYVIGQGPNIFGLEYPKFTGFPQQVDFCKQKLDSRAPYLDWFVIDAGGGGRQIHQQLVSDGYGARVRLVNYGAEAKEPLKYANVKAEMSFRCREALLDEVTPTSLPDDPKLKIEMTIEGSNMFSSLDGSLQMESKKSLKARGHKSPGGYDAVRQLYAFKLKKKAMVAGKGAVATNMNKRTAAGPRVATSKRSIRSRR